MYALLSPQTLGLRLKQLVARLPIVLVVTLVATISFIVTVERNTENYRLLFASALAFPWTIFAALMAERLAWKKSHALLAQIIVAIIAGSYYMAFPAQDVFDNNPIPFVRWGMLVAIGSILLLSLPYDIRDTNQFWQRIWRVVQGAIIAVAFGLGMWLGVLLATFALGYLFEAFSHWQDEILTYAGAIVFGIVTAWLFLAQLPKPGETISFEAGKIPRLFLEYIWLPMVGIFLVILYAYFAKILITWQWPEGGVVYWVLGFLSLGFLAYFLAYGIDIFTPQWKSRYFRLFFIAAIPMLGILFVAIGLRIQEYGITEKRYLVVAGGIFLLLLSCYYLLSREKRLSFTAYLLALFLLVASVGPWNMFSVSLANQVKQLEEILVRYEIFQGGQVVKKPSETQLPREEVARINSILRYLATYDAFDLIQPWFSQPLEGGENSYQRSQRVLQLLGVTNNRSISDETYFSYSSYDRAIVPSIMDLRGYDFVIQQIHLSPGREPVEIDTKGFGEFRFALTGSSVTIVRNGVMLVTVDLEKIVKDIRTRYGTVQADHTFYEEDVAVTVPTSKGFIRFVITDISGTKEDNGKADISYVRFMVFGER